MGVMQVRALFVMKACEGGESLDFADGSLTLGFGCSSHSLHKAEVLGFESTGGLCGTGLSKLTTHTCFTSLIQRPLH